MLPLPMNDSPAPRPLLEICLESVAGCEAAEQGGADRVELCANLLEGGTTPSPGALKLARARCRLPIMSMVRPRGGDFLYDATEFAVMEADVDAARDAGMDGVVLGLLLPDGQVDAERTARLVARARPMEVTFHRAFDMSRDPFEALEVLVSLGVERILSSGQEAGVPAGLDLLERLQEAAGDRIGILPGCGIDPENVRATVERLRPKEIHFTAARAEESGMRFRNPRCFMGAHTPPGEYELQRTSAEVVRRYVDALA